VADDELQAALAREANLRERLRVFGHIREALGRLRGLGSVEAMIERAPEETALACDVDRVAVYGVSDGLLVAESFFVRDDPAAAKTLLAFSRRHPAPLNEQILEREMLRRRRPMVVLDAQQHPQTFKALVRPYDTHAYVAAPIMPEGRVIGFLHADKGVQRPGDPNGVDELDRDAVWAFAEGFGYAIERMRLLERLRGQAQDVRRLIGQTEALLGDHLEAQVELATGPSSGDPLAHTAAALFPGPEAGIEGQLTPREQEVLALVAEGATNGQIAARLVITEDTAKSHVKRILRKLGAGNRVEAAAIYLRARG
jgi:DNA-binding CsgD family transcriptional regulator